MRLPQDQPPHDQRLDQNLDPLLDNTLVQRLDTCPDLQTARIHHVNLVLDPDSAHPWLVVSEDRQQVHNDNVWKQKLRNHRRFTYLPAVVGKPSWSSGQFYFEVRVPGPYWDLGVTVEGSRRYGDFYGCPENKYWRIELRGDTYIACSHPPRTLKNVSRLQTVGVYVDIDLRIVAFYDADSGVLIYSFRNCTFTGPVVPYLSPQLNYSGINSDPLVLVQPLDSPELDR